MVVGSFDGEKMQEERENRRGRKVKSKFGGKEMLPRE